MKGIPILLVVLVFIILFCAGFIGTSKLTIFYLERINMYSVKNNTDPYFWMMVFTENKVTTIHFSELEEFKKENPNYSFLVPKGKESYYNDLLPSEYKKPSFNFEVEQLSEEKQLIKLNTAGSLSVGTNTYVAIDKEIFPKTYSGFNFIDTFLLFVVSSVGGAIICFIFFFIHKR